MSESGFTGLKDLQDSAGERVRDRRALVDIRIGGIFGYGENRKAGVSAGERLCQNQDLQD